MRNLRSPQYPSSVLMISSSTCLLRIALFVTAVSFTIPLAVYALSSEVRGPMFDARLLRSVLVYFEDLVILRERGAMLMLAKLTLALFMAVTKPSEEPEFDFLCRDLVPS